MAKTKQKYYVVWRGKQPGVYTDWDECFEQVKGFEGAKYKSFSSITEAEEAFQKTPEEYIQPKATATKKTISPLCGRGAGGEVIVPSLCVDAACSGNPGNMEYRGVYLLDIHQNGEREERELFRRGPFPEGTNNIGEFLALVHGLAELHKQGNTTLTIYSDSRTAQSWVKQKKAKTKLVQTANNALLFQLIQRAENWLQTHTWNNPILKWDTEHWGEIPADFGRK